MEAEQGSPGGYAIPFYTMKHSVNVCFSPLNIAAIRLKEILKPVISLLGMPE